MLNSAEDRIRSFGMSGLLIDAEIREIEKRFDLDLGHSSRPSAASAPAYYSQFESEVRREASQMATHYQTFYCLEKAIRKLITESMQEAEGEAWWNSGRIAGDILAYVKTTIDKEVDSGVSRRSIQNIDYTTFGQLSVIIVSNWDIFGSIFNSRKAVERVMSNLNLLRGPMAHCSPLSEDEVIRLELTVKDWFRMMQ